MKNVLLFEPSGKPEETIPLACMIGQQLQWFQPQAVKNNSFIINDVPTDFKVTANKNLLAVVIYNLFDSIVRKTSNSCIRATVNRFGSTVLLRVTNAADAYQQIFDLNDLAPIAKQLGGWITTSKASPKNLTVAFSFQSADNAA
ncbi:MAG TPA: hypothetical protein VD993_02055 [Chitinophagaceae bacterium]|nr:hypothetical protein [Chitinophagaceae bacterium]